MSDSRGESELSRRSFVVSAAIAGAGLVIGIRIPTRQRGAFAAPSPASNAEPFAPNAWIRLDESGDVTILVHKSEMGQGVWTALPMIVAEEMDVDWHRVRADRAPTRPDLETATGGSSSVSDSYMPLRRAGAAARAMLVAAAAKRWGFTDSECTTNAGEVIHAATRRRLAYGALARDAAALPPPDEKSLTLKDPRTFRLLGRDTPRLDTRAKVTGRATFGIDVKVPGMLVAVVARCPTFAGKVARVDDTRARAVPGVRQVITLDPVPRQLPGRVAVLADDTWSAMQGRKALSISTILYTTPSEGASAEVDNSVPTPNTSMGARAATSSWILYSFRSPVAMIFASRSPASSRILRTAGASSTRLPLSSRTPHSGRPSAAARRAPSSVS